MSLPDWVRARGLALHVSLTFGAMTLGSLAWGELASVVGVAAALLAAAVGALAAIPLAARWRIQSGTALDLSPTTHWPAAIASGEIDQETGPVLVTIEYRVAATSRAAFLAERGALERQRRRTGAYAWELFEDAADPERFVETFHVESWLEHLRQHDRITVADYKVDERMARVAAERRISHLVPPRER